MVDLHRKQQKSQITYYNQKIFITYKQISKRTETSLLPSITTHAVIAKFAERERERGGKNGQFRFVKQEKNRK